MRRRNGNNRKQTVKKERAIMLVSSAFVLTALTLTGFYVKGNNKKEQFDGYTVDFSSLENSVDDKYDEIARKAEEAEEDLLSGLQSVDSGDIQIPGLTDQKTVENNTDVVGDVELSEITDLTIEEPVQIAEAGDIVEEDLTEDVSVEAAPQVQTHPALEYQETQGLSWPVSGEVLIDYSMDKTTYFPTLDQYKCSSAVVISSEEGTKVCASASGKVVDIFEDAEIGNAVIMDLGNGYQLTYGQLENITVSVGSYVEAGTEFATVSKPSKYYSVEGSNVYFKLTKDNAPMNPLTLLSDY